MKGLMNRTTKRTIVQCTCDQQRLRLVYVSAHYIKQASWIARSPKKVHTVRSAKGLIRMSHWLSRTISECSDQNMQLHRLTRIFARHTRHFVKPIDCRRYIVHTISEGSDQTTDVQAQSVQADSSLCTNFIVGFAMHRPMRYLIVQTITLNILGKVFNRRHFEIFFHSSKKTGFAFHANCLHCMKCQILCSW